MTFGIGLVETLCQTPMGRCSSVPARSRCAQPLDPHGPRAGVRSACPAGFGMGSVGRGRFGRPAETPSRFFGLLAPNSAFRCLENPRVDGSIPSLATTSNFLIFMSFRASPADHRAPFCPEIG